MNITVTLQIVGGATFNNVVLNSLALREGEILTNAGILYRVQEVRWQAGGTAQVLVIPG